MINERIKERIHGEWFNPQVAQWAIGQLPLLDIPTKPACQIFPLSEVRSSIPLQPVKRLIIAGGLEGTAGHINAFEFARETRALMEENPIGALPIFALLEPDSFIEKKGRKPLVTQAERGELWAGSGLVDGVILLPDKKQNVKRTDHYSAIHRLIAPALWLTTGDNPAVVEISKRESGENVNFGSIIPRTVTPHASFISKTKSMGKDDVRAALLEHISSLYYQKYENLFAFAPGEQHFTVIKKITDKIAQGL